MIFTDDEITMLNLFNRLNDEGKAEMIKRLHEMERCIEYTAYQDEMGGIAEVVEMEGGVE